MVRIYHRQREQALIRLGERDREVVAAWFVLLLVAAAGLSFLSIQQYAASDCPTTLARSIVLHRSLAVSEDWEDPACPFRLCSHTLSAHERNDESGGTAERADDPAAAYSGTHKMPLDPIENTGKERRELLCS
jgi:hypothetical protein